MKLSKKAGETSVILQVFIQDSAQSDGRGLAGLVFNSAGLAAYFHREGDTAATQITLVDMTVGTFTSGGFKEIDATNMKGWYQFCPPDAAIAAGAKSVGFQLEGAANMAPLPVELQLVGYDPNDGAGLGLSNLDVVLSSRAGSGTEVDAAAIRALVEARLDVILSSRAGSGAEVDAAAIRALVEASLDVVLSSRAASGVQDANLVQIQGATGAVDRLKRVTDSEVLGAVDAGSSQTSIVTASLDPAATVADQFKGRVVLFDRATTTPELRGQGTRITANTSGGVLTVEALTVAPASGDTFAIV